MFIWIPVNNNHEASAKITKVIDAKQWALVDFTDGEVKSTQFFENRENFKEWVDFVIVKDKYESSIEFMNHGMMVLCTRNEETIDEITEAFKFKELDEVGF